MKLIRIALISAMVLASSMSLSAQSRRDTVITGNGFRYEGQWPAGKGSLFSSGDGLIVGSFAKGTPDGECICFRPDGQLFWGNYSKGKQKGYGRLYRDSGIVMAGDFKNGRYHGTDTLYRTDGSVLVGKFRNGKLKARLAAYDALPESVPGRPRYPKVDLTPAHEAFLRDMEIQLERNHERIRHSAGMVNPRFNGGDIEDFAIWVNSNLINPYTARAVEMSRTVIVEFTVTKDGSVTDVHAVFGSDRLLNEEAIRVVQSSPKWTPAEHRGEKKSVRLSVPVIFGM